MRVVAISDLHGLDVPDVPPCDLLIVAGDCLGGAFSQGRLQQRRAPIDRFRSWLERQPAETIVGIAGNHDYIAEREPAVVRDLPWIYLQDEGCVVDGVKVWGSPWATRFGSWAFMLPEDQLAMKWALIPDDTEILVVHGPAHGVLDKAWRDHVGSISLRERLRELPALRLFACGHIHESYGETRLPIHTSYPADMRWLHCVNAAVPNHQTGKINPPVVIDLPDRKEQPCAA